jgi:hypothetical protein
MANAVLGAPFFTNVFDPNTGKFLTGGQIFFYASDGVTLKDVFDSPTKEQTLPNPFTFDSIASFPPIYYDIDDNYVIEVREAPDPCCPAIPGAIVYGPFDYFPPGAASGSTEGEVLNFVPNGQFLFPINFNKADEDAGELDGDVVEIAASWEFVARNLETPNSLRVFVENIHNQDLSGNPYNHVRVSNLDVDPKATNIELLTTLGYVNVLQGQPVTFSMLAQALTGNAPVVTLILERDFNDESNEEIIIGTFNIPSNLEDVILNFTMPDNFSGNLDVYDARTYLKLRFPNNEIYNITITNVQLEKGTINTPVYIENPLNVSRAHIIGDMTILPSEEFPEIEGYDEYTQEIYSKNKFRPRLNTGDIEIRFIGNLGDDELFSEGQSLSVTKYTGYIPNRRLFDVIGDSFGGAGELNISSNGGDVIFRSIVGARPNSTYTVGDTSFTLSQDQIGLKLGVSASLFSSNEIDLTFADKFAPSLSFPGQSFSIGGPSSYSNPSRIVGSWFTYTTTGNVSTTRRFLNGFGTGNQAILSTDIDAGSPSTNAIARLLFNSANISDYETNSQTLPAENDNTFAILYKNYLEFPSIQNNTHGRALTFFSAGFASQASPSPAQILFSVDGKIGGHIDGPSSTTLIFDFLKDQSVTKNLERLETAINNEFIERFTISSSPSPGQHILISSSTVDYYFWFFLTDGGGGTDPLIPGRTGVQINISSVDTNEQIAESIAIQGQAAITDFTFNLPAQADFPAIPNANFKYAIKL